MEKQIILTNDNKEEVLKLIREGFNNLKKDKVLSYFIIEKDNKLVPDYDPRIASFNKNNIRAEIYENNILLYNKETHFADLNMNDKILINDKVISIYEDVEGEDYDKRVLVFSNVRNVYE